MRFVRLGQTRGVILVGPYALKVARLGLGYALRRTIEILRSGQAREKFIEWRRNRTLSVPGVVGAAIFRGVLSNMKEYRRSRVYSDLGLMPTLWTFFYLVNVQRRGEPVADATTLKHPLLSLLSRSERRRTDLDPLAQYCWHGSQLVLVDYAHPDLEALLVRHRPKPVS